MRQKFIAAIVLSLTVFGCNNDSPKTVGDLIRKRPKISEAIASIDSISSLSKSDQRWLAAYLVRGNLSKNIDETLTLVDAAKLQKERYEQDSINESIKYANLLKQIPSKGKYEHSYKISTEYDKFKDYSTLKIDDLPLTKTINISFYETYSGKVAPNALPSSINCMITSSTESWEFLSSHDVTFLLNKNTRLHYETQHDGTVGSGYVLEFMTFDIPVSDFIQIANASSIELQIFTTEAKIGQKQLNGIRDFASKLIP